ncbi:type II secretion system protein [Bdellovibrio svalbardensis]|uniref:Prepilin-type N-terminal cleavage/methylation domain-containing protein n=1 Tax=Bdellovibrio svalbardensis TaxID=2972972 RepID=A0ABT6DMU1_9BACT|nr:prepilin-type N-terminal cleavage/methylation domain-containing protein [Bdellovibrio svalbardensis]MDG0817415.1 prepilin-type N-terminal cleavage/methylation domain-containing protein [Bdellovibrio svalbardensis]
MKRLKHLRSNSGFTLVEILIALSLFGMLTSGIMTMNTWLNNSVATEASKVDRDIENTEMLKLVTQPLYFGSLQDFPENEQLAQCMKIDTRECNTDTDYKLIPFNLTTKTKMFLASTTNESGNIKNELTFRVHCPENKTFCDRASYYTVTVKTFINYLSFKSALVEKKGVVTPDFTNVVTYVPDNTVASGRPINVVLFVDNSNSMVFAKDQIKSALEALLNKLSTMNVTVGLYPLVTPYTSTANRYYLDTNGNQITTMPPYPYPGNFTYYELYSVAGSWRNYKSSFNPTSYITNYPEGANAVFPFLTSDDTSLRTSKLDSMKNLVESYFNYPTTSSLDTPLCSLIRYLETPQSPSPFSMDQFTPTAFFIISNEDDETDFNLAWFQNGSCLKGYLMKWTVSPTTYNYWGRNQQKVFNFSANVLLDGAPATLNALFSTSTSYDSKYINGDSCDADIATMNSAAAEKMISQTVATSYPNYKYIPGSGFTLTKCLVQTPYFIIKLGLPSPDATICPAFESSNPPSSSYIPGSCYERYDNIGTQGGSVQSYPLMPGISNPVDAAYKSIQDHLNLANVLYIPIVHTDATTCTLTPGSQVGTRYMALGNKPGINSKPIPICSPDYSAHLSKLDQWIADFAANDLQLSPSVAANFSSVELSRNGATITLTSNVDFSLVGTTLSFKPGILQPNDVIRVYLK